MKAGIAHRLQIHHAFEAGHGFVGLQRLTAVILFTPVLIEAEVCNDIGQHALRFDRLKLILNEVRIINSRPTYSWVVHESRDVRLVALDFDSSHAGIGLRQNEGHQGGGDNDEQKYRQDDGLADADDAPVVEKMPFVFLWRRSSLMDP